MPRLLPDWVKGYLDYTHASESPTIFHMWSAIGTIAGAMQRNVYFDQMYFKWFPNFYIIFVAKPGIVNKSTTIDIGMNFLHKLEGITFGPESVTWQALVTKLADSKKLVEYPNGVIEPTCCMTLAISEFGTFFTNKDEKLVDHLVSLWDGKAKFEKLTKMNGADIIENPVLNIIAGTTPSWLHNNFPEYMIGGGFMSRCIFVQANEKRHYIAHPKRHKSVELSELENLLLHDLNEISKIKGEYVLDKEAEAFGEEWYPTIFENSAGKDERMLGYTARKQSHVYKLSMILAASKRDELVITKEDMKSAIHLVDLVESNLSGIFNFVGSTPEGNIALQILQLVEMVGEVTREELYSRFLSRASNRQIDEVILAVGKSGKVRIEHSPTSFKLISKKKLKQDEPKDQK